jgi:hypothetical protein
MSGSPTWTPGPPAPTGQPTWSPSPGPIIDPNELLRRIDARTAEMVSWVKYGTIAIIILLVAIAVGV